MTEEIQNSIPQSFDQDGNIVRYGEPSSNGVVDAPLDKDGKPMMTASIETDKPRTYRLDVNLPTKEELQSQKIEKIISDGLKACREENTITSHDVVNGHLSEDSLTARKRCGEPVSLSKATENDLIKLPNIGETEVPIAETMGYIERNANGIGYHEVNE